MAIVGQKDENFGSGGSAYLGSGNGMGATTDVKKDDESPTASGGYTNLLNYIGANQGAGQEMGNAVAGHVGEAGQEVDRSLDDWRNQGMAEIGANSLSYDPSKYTSIVAGLQNYSAPTSGYAAGQGPQSATELQSRPDSAKIDALGKLVQQAGNGYSGASNLLYQTYAGPHYSAGENSLDAFLVGNSAEGRQAMQGIQDQWGGMDQKYQGINDYLNARRAEAKNDSGWANFAYQDAQKKGDAARERAKAVAPVMTERHEAPVVKDELNQPESSSPTPAPENNSPSEETEPAFWFAHGGKVPQRFPGIHSLFSR